MSIHLRSPDSLRAAAGETITVDRVLGKQRENVQKYVLEIMEHIADNDVEPYAKDIKGGDLRFRIANRTFAEIKFFRKLDEIMIRLYFEPGRILNEEYAVNRVTGKLINYDRRLNVKEPLPEDLVLLFEESRRFARSEQ